VLELVRQQDRIGGKTTAANMTRAARVKRSKTAHGAMTPEQRQLRALKTMRTGVRARQRKGWNWLYCQAE
jgi:hypothetical protein